jgi:hypothetical protein
MARASLAQRVLPLQLLVQLGQQALHAQLGPMEPSELLVPQASHELLGLVLCALQALLLLLLLVLQRS